MSELLFKIICTGIVGCTIVAALSFSIYILAKADDWVDRMLAILLIFINMFFVLVIALIWSVDIRGLD